MRHISLVFLLLTLSSGKENIASHDFTYSTVKTTIFIINMRVHLDLDGRLQFKYLVSNQNVYSINVQEPLKLGTYKYLHKHSYAYRYNKKKSVGWKTSDPILNVRLVSCF